MCSMFPGSTCVQQTKFLANANGDLTDELKNIFCVFAYTTCKFGRSSSEISREEDISNYPNCLATLNLHSSLQDRLSITMHHEA